MHIEPFKETILILIRKDWANSLFGVLVRIRSDEERKIIVIIRSVGVVIRILVRKGNAMIWERNRIIYIPYSENNKFINGMLANMAAILKRKYVVKESLAEPVDIFEMLRTKAVILNWVEERLDGKMKLQLFLHKLFGVRIIWFFHNKMPHDMAGGHNALDNMLWLSNVSDVICLLSKNSKKHIPDYKKNCRKAVYIPHIMYKSRIDAIDVDKIRNKYGVSDQDFVFLIFGLIRPYKNIEAGIEAFKELGAADAKLMIVGNPVNRRYAKQIRDLCARDHNIILDMRYIPDELMDGIIGISDIVVLPYQDKTSMNSGVMIQAFSNARTVIAPNICMARDFMKEKFLYVYKDDLGKVIKRAYRRGREENRKMGEQALDYMRLHHCEEKVARKLFAILK